MLAAAGTVALAFAATPFLVPEIAAELDVRLGTAGLLSTFQVGGFAATTFLAGRLLRPQASIHKIGLIATGLAHLLCARRTRVLDGPGAAASRRASGWDS